MNLFRTIISLLLYFSNSDKGSLKSSREGAGVLADVGMKFFKKNRADEKRTSRILTIYASLV